MSFFKSDLDLYIEEIQKRNPTAVNLRCVDTKKNFLRGSLFTIAFDITDPKTNEAKSFVNRVYQHDGSFDVYANDELLLAIVGETHKRLSLKEVFNQSSMAAFIAVILTLTICILSFIGGENPQIPDILKNALTVILGFYFGTKVNIHQQEEKKD